MDSKVIKINKTYAINSMMFFANIGPKLASQIKPSSNKTYDTFLKRRVLTWFAFILVSENDVLKHLSSLRTKNSAGIDRISVKLFKMLSSALINPSTLIINQSLVTGIFPYKLSIAKVLPLFKNMMVLSRTITTQSHYQPPSLNFLKMLSFLSFMINLIITICSMIASMGF